MNETSERIQLVQLLRQMTEGECDSAPMVWCVEAAEAAIKKIMELAEQDSKDAGCRWCDVGRGDQVTHSHKWHERGGLLARLSGLLPYEVMN